LKLTHPLPEASVFTVCVLATAQEVEGVRSIWTAWRKNPEADIDYFLLMLRLRPEIVRPHVLVVYEKGEPVTIVAGRIEDSPLEITSGNRLFWRSKVRRLALFHAGFMGRTDACATEFVTRHLVRSIRELGVDLMLWDGVEQESPLRRFLRTTPNPLCRDYLARGSEHWIMHLPASLEELLQKRMNKKRRYWARRIIRTVEKDFSGAVRHAHFCTAESVEALWKDVQAVARQSYQWALGVGFRDTEEQRGRLEIAARKGWLRAWVLYLGDRPAAFWLCTLHGDSLCLDYTGFDPAFRKYEVGTVALFQIFDEMCKAGVKHVDLGGGSYVYKQKFGNHQFDEASILTFAPTFRGVTLNLFRLLILGPVELVRWVAGCFGLEPALKKLWQRGQKPPLKPVDDDAVKRIAASGLFNQERKAAGKRVGIALWRSIFVILLMAVFYLAWKPSPAIALVPWMPAMLGSWFDQHDFTKNVVGFGILAAAGFMAWKRPSHTGNQKSLRRLKTFPNGKLFVAFCLLVVVLELGQLTLPKRNCDWVDVLAGWSGVALAWCLNRVKDVVVATGGSAAGAARSKFLAAADRRS